MKRTAHITTILLSTAVALGLCGGCRVNVHLEDYGLSVASVHEDESDSGTAVEQMQNLLTIIAYFDNSIPLPAMNGVFDARTKNSLMAFQTQYGLEPTGVLNRQSANMLLSVYRDTRAMATENGKSVSRLIYPGRAILRGRTGADVEDLQSLINRAAAQNAFIPQVAEDGIFGEATENAVKAVQAHEGLDVNGIVGPLTWQALLRLSGLSP